jgi:hypothetical protein
MPELRLFSFGGGVQSTAVMVLQAQGKLAQRFDVFVHANVGHDSENPKTVAYMRDYAEPYMQAHGIRFETTQKTTRGEPETLHEYAYRTQKSIPIPAFMSGGAPGNRTCTANFKIDVLDRWIRAQGVDRATFGLGISTDEMRRMRGENWYDNYQGRKLGFMKRLAHPLIDHGVSREDCRRIITDAGLPMPPKSSCYFCPFTRMSEWVEMRREDPDLFEKAAELEDMLNEKRAALGRDELYLSSKLRPLREIVPQQPLLFEMEDETNDCGSGYCWT